MPSLSLEAVAKYCEDAWCAYSWEFGLRKVFSPSAFMKVAVQAVESSAPAREGSTIPLHSKE